MIEHKLDGVCGHAAVWRVTVPGVLPGLNRRVCPLRQGRAIVTLPHPFFLHFLSILSIVLIDHLVTQNVKGQGQARRIEATIIFLQPRIVSTKIHVHDATWKGRWRSKICIRIWIPFLDGLAVAHRVTRLSLFFC